MKHSKERIEGFSDAIFAFAATLVVVSFDIPKVFSELQDMRWEFLSFGISFMALVLIWVVHYKYFRRITDIDFVIIAINMFLLFVILFYVYPLKFLSYTFIGEAQFENHSDLAYLFIIYGIGFILIFTCISLLYSYSSKLETDPKLQNELSHLKGHYFLYAAVGLITILLSIFRVGIAYGIPGMAYILIGPLCWWHDKKWRKQLAKTASI